MAESILDYVLAVDGRCHCPQLTGGETEAQKGKMISLTYRALAQLELCMWETNAM